MSSFDIRWRKALSRELGVDRLPQVSHENHTLVKRQADLPEASGGTITLESSHVYEWDGFVILDTPLEWSGITVHKGRHGGVDGVLYTGSGAVFRGSGYILMSDMLVSTPGADVFDMSGTVDTEILCESVTFADPAGMGKINSLGTIDTYRVPSFKGCNFEDFDDGLTFTGDIEKIFFSECPFRTVTASGVTCLTFDVDSISIVDIVDCYVKGVQSDTKVVDVKPGSFPSEVFQYRGTTHDSSVTKSNILTGEVGVKTVGTKVLGSYPLRDSTVGGQVNIDTAGVVTGSGTTPTQIGSQNTTTTASNLERMSSPSDGVLQYDANYDEIVTVNLHVGALGAQTIFSIYIGKNGSEITTSRSAGLLSNVNDAETLSTSAKVELTEGDTIEAYIENEGGSDDLTAGSFVMTV